LVCSVYIIIQVIDFFKPPPVICPVKRYKYPNKPKLILFWNGLFGLKNWGLKEFSKDVFKERRCEQTNCVYSHDRNMLPIADAVYFHSWPGDYRALPERKCPGQIWVLMSHEPPYLIQPKLYNNVINWTQGYKLNSDIYMSYRDYCLRDQPVKINFKNTLNKKTKMVAWFVANCKTPSRREDYVRELMKYIQVDVYGKCSHMFNQNNICTRDKENTCLETLENDYKFYLSFESCFHDGYVTEKYYKILNLNVVPIVRGSGNYSQIAIPNSYINTADFKSPKELAAYLLELNKNNEKYLEYLKYKEKYKIDFNDPGCKLKDNGYCLMCKMLNENKTAAKYYTDMEKWYGKCERPNDIKIQD